MKKLIDMTAGLILAIVTLPLLVIVTVVAGVRLWAWPIFLQARVGRGGRPFTMPKVRTLHRSFPSNALKTAADPSRATTRLLGWIRHMHLDELPQLWLVATGKLSLIGPRPKLLDEHEPVDPTYARLRTLTRQGCTGLWQISIHRDDLPSRHPEYDYAYLRWRGFRLDAWIAWRTVIGFFRLGARISLEDIPARVLGAGAPELSDADRELLDGLLSPRAERAHVEYDLSSA